MNNPISVFFGKSVLADLRRFPSAILKVVERIKPFLMAAVHEAQGQAADPERARRISEAHLAIKTASTDQIDRWVEEFIVEVHGRENALSSQLSSLRVAYERLEESHIRQTQELALFRSKPETLKKKVELPKREYVTALEWFMSGILANEITSRHPLESPFPKDSIPRGALHRYRVIVEKERAYHAYEFDITGRIRYHIEAEFLDTARKARILRGGRSRWEKVQLRSSHSILIGCSEGVLTRTLVRDALVDGLIKPYVMVGMHPVLLGGRKINDEVLTQEVHNSILGPGKIIEIISLEKARELLMGSAGKKPPTSPLQAKLREHRAKQRLKK